MHSSNSTDDIINRGILTNSEIDLQAGEAIIVMLNKPHNHIRLIPTMGVRLHRLLYRLIGI